ncbi:RND family transporter [Thermodesulfobacteriota bacterium]
MPNLPRKLDPAAGLAYVVDHPRTVIIFILLITLFFASLLPDLRFHTSIYHLAVEDLDETRQYHAFKQEFGSEELILVVAKADDIFDPPVFRQIDRMARELSQIKGIKRIVSLPGIKKAMEITDQWTLADFKKTITHVSLFQRNLISEDGKTTTITLILDDIEEKEPIIDAVSSIIDQNRASLSLYQIGMPLVARAMAEFTKQDFVRLPPAIFLLICLILFLLFRNLRGVLIPAGAVLIALIWTFGIMAWSGTPISMLTVIVPIFIIAVGTAYCMYIFPEYQSAVRETDSPREASFKCFSRLALPTALAVVTTTIGLGSLVINKMSAIREFALFSCLGILFMLIIIFTLLPAVMALLPVPARNGERSTGRDLFDPILAAIARFNLKHQKISLSLIAVTALLGMIGISRIPVETNPIGFFKEESSIYRNFHDVYRDMAGSFPINVVLNSREEDFFIWL